MKILFCGMAKLKYMPYMDFYLNKVDLSKDEVHILYWDRDGKEDGVPDKRINLHCFKCDIEDGESMKKKIPCFIKYRKFAKKILKDVKPDRIVVHYQNTGILIYDSLMKKYSGKYILDYRDVTYERISFFRKMVAKLVEHSFATFTSSDGFRKFLPESDKIHTSHNLIKSSLNSRDNIISGHTPSDKIRVAFWGMIRHVDVNSEIIRKLGNDDRFELHYYGRAQRQMLTLLNDSTNKYKNVFFHGEYLPEERYEFAKHTDLIHNIYDNNDKTMPIAMANKFYDGPVFGIPQLCVKGSYMGKLCEKYGIGLACDPYEDNFADSLFDYFSNIKPETFEQNSKEFLEHVMKEIDSGEKVLSDFFDEHR